MDSGTQEPGEQETHGTQDPGIKGPSAQREMVPEN